MENNKITDHAKYTNNNDAQSVGLLNIFFQHQLEYHNKELSIIIMF